MKKAMKIGIDARELISGKTTGIGRFLLEFLKVARSCGKFEFVLFGNRHTDFESPELKGYKKIVIDEYLTILWDQFQLKKAIEQNKIDIFFSPYYKFPLMSSAPCVISIFDITYLLIEPYKNQWINKFYRRNFLKLAEKKAKKILTISHNTKHDLVKLLNLPKEKIEVVYLSVNEKFKPQEKVAIERVRSKYNIGKKYILYVGNSKPHKNLNRLIDAYNFLPEIIKKEYLLVLAGVGSEVNGQGAEVRIIRYVSEEDLPAVYSGAELFIFPSLYEGFGLPPLEAMACGCPVLSSNASCMPEILGDACIYFDPLNAREISAEIEQILCDASLKNGLKEKGLIKVKEYVPAKIAQKTIDVIDSVFKRN
ncbi:MAG: glycosyltransferase family 4 protein [Elusimicrobia bacterium]|nr:glycosyltransferase family 4 protein [Elusimicrobiota bacterium]